MVVAMNAAMLQTRLGACGPRLPAQPRRAVPGGVRSVARLVVQANGEKKGIDPELKKQDLKTRGFRRTVYDFDLWTKHRSITRYTSNLSTIPSSRIIRSLSQPIGVVLGFSTLVGVYHTLLEGGVLPDGFPKFTLPTAEPQSLTSFALSLLLVFRTNSSYGRFDEARKIWGGILNRCRNIANQAVTFVPADDPKGREAVGKWTVGFCQALRAHLQEDADIRAELAKCEPKWTKEEIEILATAQHRPIKAISMLSELTNQLNITQFQAMQMQENVQFFYDALGGCERLLRTPIPVSYTRHTSRFLILWMSLLPLGLWDRYHWAMLPAIALIGFLLLGIDEIGVQIEEPFGILPLDVISKRAETDINSLLKENDKVVNYIADYRAGRLEMDASTAAMLGESDFAAAAAAVSAINSAPPAKPAAAPAAPSPSKDQGWSWPSLGSLLPDSSMLSGFNAAAKRATPAAKSTAPAAPSYPADTTADDSDDNTTYTSSFTFASPSSPSSSSSSFSSETDLGRSSSPGTVGNWRDSMDSDSFSPSPAREGRSNGNGNSSSSGSLLDAVDQEAAERFGAIASRGRSPVRAGSAGRPKTRSDWRSDI